MVQSVEEAKDLASGVLSASLLVVHDTSGGRQNNVAELTGGEEVTHPLLDIANLDVKAGADNTALVQAAGQLNNNLARAVVVDHLELADVAVGLHGLEELDKDLGAGAKEHLLLTALLRVGERLESIREHVHAHHFVCDPKCVYHAKVLPNCVYLSFVIAFNCNNIIAKATLKAIKLYVISTTR
eukprot:CAMPEP_0171519688 /NCGR_PEP_ID=MMETSP0959-20130129/6037_1 /TAXON_ID=87120 /ORGANISM="Aurantiochytrium limacinum, Strain ATCCMYA-1381" /LENGTH=183 /DNA_ID=CAMNT_0012059149 /DNA_START=649 /DNA_END=1201 /DNA_ORIENTATION=-